MLSSVFAALDRADMPYCVTHGYESLPQRITSSDVDIIIPATVRPSQLAALLYENAQTFGGPQLVCCRGYYMVLTSGNVDGSLCFLELDFRPDYDLGGLRFYTGKEVVASRRKHNRHWIPAPALEFGCYLVRRLMKRQLSRDQGLRLGALYAQDRVGCDRQIARFWGRRRAALVASAAHCGDWESVRHRLVLLGVELRARAMLRRPWVMLASCLRRMVRRMKLLYRPEGGLSIVFLGPDGAGKTSVITAMTCNMIGPFPRAKCYSFPPALLTRLLHRPEGPYRLPHQLPPRSFMMSVVRAVCYWLVYYLVFHSTAIRLQLARSTLVLHDRHLVDTLVDPKRYRYSGPLWLLRLIWRFVPEPDLVILLDAPPEVLQSRKQEVSSAESDRQRKAYRSLVGSMANGRIVDAARPLDEVVHAVEGLLLDVFRRAFYAACGASGTGSARSSRCRRQAGIELLVP
jgi:thymidylate kinase